ncbi:transposase [Paraburkholderia sediminicola]|uniref:transposase n=1 Tax=Paraburkholderia sediminicola TaxID=458836 RepID=UPI0038BD63FF
MIELPLSDAAWLKVTHLFAAPAPRGRPRADPRAVLNAILWVEQNGEHWKHLPAIFPSQQTCYARFMIWWGDGILQKVKQALSEKTDSSTSISDPAMSPS